MESVDHRHGKKTRLLSPIACSVLAMGFCVESLADITNVSSTAQSSLNAEARVGYATPPSTIRADVKPKLIGDRAPVAGLPDMIVNDFTYAGVSTTVAGYVRSSADVRGSISRSGQVAGDSLSASFGGAAGIDLQASLDKTRGSYPTNMAAQAVGAMTTVETVTFTLNVPSAFTATGYVNAFGPSTARAWLVDASGVVLFEVVVSQSAADPNGSPTFKRLDAVGSLEPGTYTLWASALASDLLETQVLSLPGQAPRTRASSYYSVQFEVTPQ